MMTALGELATVFAGVECTKANLNREAGAPYGLIQCRDLLHAKFPPRSLLRTAYFGPLSGVKPLVVRAGDLLVALASERIAIVPLPWRLDSCVPDSHVAVIRAHTPEGYGRIVAQLSLAEVRRRLEDAKGGDIVRQLAVKHLEAVPIPEP
jgi:hypothetical protein